MKPNRILDEQSGTPVWRPLRLLVMLLLSVGLVVTGPVSAALAGSTTPVVQVTGVEDETFDDAAHNERLADTGA